MMSNAGREQHVGACNEPQPHNWRNACVLRPGHEGEHRAPNSQYTDFAWTGGSVRLVSKKPR
jgi:hypothetical protein